MRALCVYGSESGQAKNSATRLSKTLKEELGIKVEGVVDGNSVGELETLAERCDVLVVVCSSFGEGDPPENYNLFLLNLMRGATNDTKPLAGLQHLVLGYGASVYDTYQNCPRLSDKYLGECGSRRLAVRGELDEGEGYAVWEKDAFEKLRNLPAADAAPVCEWTKPESKILEKSEEDLLLGMTEGGSAINAPAIAAGVVAVAVGAAAYYYNYYM